MNRTSPTTGSRWRSDCSRRSRRPGFRLRSAAWTPRSRSSGVQRSIHRRRAGCPARLPESFPLWPWSPFCFGGEWSTNPVTRLVRRQPIHDVAHGVAAICIRGGLVAVAMAGHRVRRPARGHSRALSTVLHRQHALSGSAARTTADCSAGSAAQQQPSRSRPGWESKSWMMWPPRGGQQDRAAPGRAQHELAVAARVESCSRSLDARRMVAGRVEMHMPSTPGRLLAQAGHTACRR